MTVLEILTYRSGWEHVRRKMHPWWQWDKTDMRVRDICTFVKSPRGLEFGPCVIWGVGSWDPLVRQKWRQIWKRCLCWRRLHNIDPALQYLHKTAQYAEWGAYNICACPYLCTYNHMLDSRGGEEGFGGRQEFRRTDLGRWVLPSGVLAGPQGYRGDPAPGFHPLQMANR